MFDSVINIFKKKKDGPEKDKEQDKEDKKTEKHLDDLIQNTNSEQNTTSKSSSSSFYLLENIELERRIFTEVLNEEINSVDPIKLYEKFASKLQNWK